MCPALSVCSRKHCISIFLPPAPVIPSRAEPRRPRPISGSVSGRGRAAGCGKWGGYSRQPHPFFLPMRGQDTGGKEEAAGPGEYGDAVLATTDGQRRRSCPTGSERTKPSALDWPLAALKAGEHDLLRCPDVGVSTHPIFPRPRRLLLPSVPPCRTSLCLVEGEDEFGSDAFRADHVDVLVVGVDDLFDDGKSQPRSLAVFSAGGIDLVEPVPDLG